MGTLLHLGLSRRSATTSTWLRGGKVCCRRRAGRVCGPNARSARQEGRPASAGRDDQRVVAPALASRHLFRPPLVVTRSRWTALSRDARRDQSRHRSKGLTPLLPLPQVEGRLREQLHFPAHPESGCACPPSLLAHCTVDSAPIPHASLIRFSLPDGLASAWVVAALNGGDRASTPWPASDRPRRDPAAGSSAGRPARAVARARCSGRPARGRSPGPRRAPPDPARPRSGCGHRPSPGHR